MFRVQVALVLVSHWLSFTSVTSLEIYQNPVSSTVVLGDSATFYCSGKGPQFSVDIFVGSNSLHYSGSGSGDGISVTVIKNDTEYNASIEIVGSEENNNTKISCEVSSVDRFTFNSSDIATLIVIGPPCIPGELQTYQHPELKELTLVWEAPYSHINYSVSNYTIHVSSLNTSDTISLIVTSTSDSVTQALSLPPHTISCHVLNISITATNDIGSSPPGFFTVSIPKVPDDDDDVKMKETVLFTADGTPVVSIEIEFPRFCWFETVKYTVVLEKVGGEGETILKNGSIVDPQDPVTETLSSDVVANTNYSVVVKSWTSHWNYTTSPLYFSTEFIPSKPSSTTINNARHDVSWMAVGLAGGLALLITIIIIFFIAIILILALMKRRKRSHQSNVEDLRVSSVPHPLTPNPIYGGPLYDTVTDPRLPTCLNLKTEPLPPIPSPSGEPKYTDSPTTGQMKLSETGDQVNRDTIKDVEDSYIFMHTRKIAAD